MFNVPFWRCEFAYASRDMAQSSGLDFIAASISQE